MKPSQLETELEHARQRISNIVRLGRVAAVDATRARIRVQSGKITTDWLPVVSPAAGAVSVWRFPSVGEQVVVLSPSGGLSAGVVLPGIYQNAFPAPSSDTGRTVIAFPDGSRVEHDSASGHITVTASAGVTIVAPKITLTGTVEISGDVEVTGSIHASGDILADGANSNHHSHT